MELRTISIGVVSVIVVILAVGAIRFYYWKQHKCIAYTGMECDEMRPLMEKALQQTVHALNQAQVPHWINCGTLLGWYRENNFICGDNDIDLAIDAEDGERFLQHVKANPLPDFKIKRHRYKRRPIGLKIYKSLGPLKGNIMYGDIYYTWTEGDTLYFDSGKGGRVSFDASTVYPLRYQHWKGCSVGLPANPESWLQSNYGPNFIQPCNTDGAPPSNAKLDGSAIYCKGRF